MKTASQFASENYPTGMGWTEYQQIACAVGYCKAIKEVIAELKKWRREAVAKEKEAESHLQEQYYAGRIDILGQLEDFLEPFTNDELTKSKYGTDRI